jgi:uncharacterized protein YdaU (DUF1376 family)
MARADVLHWTPGDYLADYKTSRLSLEEHGAYHLLLWHMWNDSETQCEFPLDYHALASIWKVPPEDAERLLDSLTNGTMAVLKIKTTRAGAVLQSKRLRLQKEQAENAHAKKVNAGRASGAVRRANKTNTARTDDEQCSGTDELSYLVSRVSSPVSRNPVSRTSAGSYPQELEPTVAYYEGKLGRELSADEITSVKRWVKQYGHDEVCVALGYAQMDGFIDNPRRIGGALKAAAARNGGAS